MALKHIITVIKEYRDMIKAGAVSYTHLVWYLLMFQDFLQKEGAVHRLERSGM